MRRMISENNDKLDKNIQALQINLNHKIDNNQNALQTSLDQKIDKQQSFTLKMFGISTTIIGFSIGIAGYLLKTGFFKGTLQ